MVGRVEGTLEKCDASPMAVFSMRVAWGALVSAYMRRRICTFGFFLRLKW